MIELIVFNYLKKHLSVPVKVERDGNLGKYVYMEKTQNSGKFVHSCTMAIQSYGGDFLNTLKLNEEVKEVMNNLIELDEITKCELVSDYIFNDSVRKKNRYQAIFEITYY